jgi:hypothetical protein
MYYTRQTIAEAAALLREADQRWYTGQSATPAPVGPADYRGKHRTPVRGVRAWLAARTWARRHGVAA